MAGWGAIDGGISLSISEKATLEELRNMVEEQVQKATAEGLQYLVILADRKVADRIRDAVGEHEGVKIYTVGEFGSQFALFFYNSYGGGRQ